MSNNAVFENTYQYDKETYIDIWRENNPKAKNGFLKIRLAGVLALIACVVFLVIDLQGLSFTWSLLSAVFFVVGVVYLILPTYTMSSAYRKTARNHGGKDWQNQTLITDAGEIQINAGAITQTLDLNDQKALSKTEHFLIFRNEKDQMTCALRKDSFQLGNSDSLLNYLTQHYPQLEIKS
jgi:hypothetical protein